MRAHPQTLCSHGGTARGACARDPAPCAAGDQVFGFDIIHAMKFKLALGFVFLSFAVCAAVRTVTDLPPSPYADTEVSSNVVFNATRGEGQMDNVKWRM